MKNYLKPPPSYDTPRIQPWVSRHLQLQGYSTGEADAEDLEVSSSKTGNGLNGEKGYRSNIGCRYLQGRDLDDDDDDDDAVKAK